MLSTYIYYLYIFLAMGNTTHKMLSVKYYTHKQYFSTFVGTMNKINADVSGTQDVLKGNCGNEILFAGRSVITS
jgi:hypothetical protein